MAASLSPVDHNALKTNQAVIILLLMLAFVADSTVLVGFVGLAMLLGTLTRRPGFVLAYWALSLLKLVQPERMMDHPEPHRFAQLVGSFLVGGAATSLLLGLPVLGWTLAWIVVALAALNLFVGFCVGCAVYYWLNRLGAPGFKHQPPEGTRAGWRPAQGDSNA